MFFSQQVTYKEGRVVVLLPEQVKLFVPNKSPASDLDVTLSLRTAKGVRIDYSTQ